jgi:hypothetical protein
MRTITLRLLGAFLLVYGIAAILLSWWAYSVTHEAYTGVRNFTAAFERERTQATDALQGASGLLGGRGSTAAGAQPSSGPAIPQRAQGLRDRLGGLLSGAPTAQPSAAPQAGPGPQPNESLGLLDELESKITQAGGGWGRLGEGPLRSGLLNQVELATNAVLVWMVAHGLASIVVGFFLLLRSPQQARPVAVGETQPWPVDMGETQRWPAPARSPDYPPDQTWPSGPPAR